MTVSKLLTGNVYCANIKYGMSCFVEVLSSALVRLVILFWCVFDILPNGFPLGFYVFCCSPAQTPKLLWKGKNSDLHPFLVLCCALILYLQLI